MLIRREEHDIDKIFRQKLHDAEEAPSTHLWEGIRQRTGGRKKYFGFWFSFALLAATVIASAAYFHSTTSKKDAITLAEIKQEMEVEKNASDASKDLTNEAKKATAEGEILVDNKMKQAENKDINEAKEDDNKNKNEARPQRNKVVMHDNNDELAKHKTKNSKTNALVANSSHRNENEMEVNENTLQKRNGDVVQELTELKVGMNQPDAHEITENTLINEFENEREFENETTGTQMAATPPTATADTTLEKAPLNLSNPKSQRWSLGVYTLLFQPYRNNAKNPTNNAELASTNPKMSLGQSVGLGIRCNLSNHFYVSSGLEFSFFKEETSWNEKGFESQYAQQYYTDSTWQYVKPDSLLIITSIPIESDTTYQEYTTAQSQINKYQSLNVPLFLGYYWARNKWQFGLEGGVVFKLMHKSSGFFRTDETAFYPPNSASIEDAPFAPYSVAGSQVETMEYYKTWNLDYHLGLRTSYNMTPKLAATFGAQFRWMAKPMERNIIEKHHIQMPGIAIGFSYHL